MKFLHLSYILLRYIFDVILFLNIYIFMLLLLIYSLCVMYHGVIINLRVIHCWQPKIAIMNMSRFNFSFIKHKTEVCIITILAKNYFDKAIRANIKRSTQSLFQNANHNSYITIIGATMSKLASFGAELQPD